MRVADYINNIWVNGGPFTGDDGKPHTRVTVQSPWPTNDVAVVNGDEDHVIHPAYNSVGALKNRGVPFRWYQKSNNSQTEVEIPNLKQVEIDRSIEADAATCNIILYNQWMYDNGAVPAAHQDEGNRHLAGYFTSGRGSSAEARARWGHETNEWADVLVPNAILRTYQGYGGHSKTREDCLTDGNLILTGVWLIDEVKVQTNGELNIQCRDMGKLLVDQQLYPPLVPSAKYPLTYNRWNYQRFSVRSRQVRRTTTGISQGVDGNRRTVYADSSSDRWYGLNFAVHGHRGVDAVDGNTSTFWLSEGSSGPTRDFATPWIEFSCGETMNAVYVLPWSGNYQMYVSVQENGIWQGTDIVPYDSSELIGEQDEVIDTGANIKYVRRYGLPVAGGEFVLPRTYTAQRVRLSFRNLAYSGLGPNVYRAGVREARIRATAASGADPSVAVPIDPILFAADAHPTAGYVTATNLWQIDAFGDARRQTADTISSTSDHVSSLRVTNSGNGYYVLDQGGRVVTFGDATHLGDPLTDGFDYVPDNNATLDMALTATGNGYYVLASRDGVFAYGDAVDYTQPTMEGQSGFFAIDAHPSGDGWWVVDGNGNTTARGDCTDFGDFTEATLNYNRLTEDFDEYAVDLKATKTGLGYWILTSVGRVQAFGDAVEYGQASLVPLTDLNFFTSYSRFITDPEDDGYYIMNGYGRITPFGNAFNYGSPTPGGSGDLRLPGNYLDYADIIKDLAFWAGFLLYNGSLSENQTPVVYGNIETTGAYAEEQLPDEIFDKRPVIDAMTEIKEVVGYLLYVDDQGGLRFESPNFWSYGNFIQETGERVTTIPEIDEKVNLFDYGTSTNDESLRSLIIISSEDPNEAGDTTVTTRLIPQTAQGLKGILKPAMWVNGWFQKEAEQRIMAELIAMHIWFAQRIGQVTCVANPAIQINDQVRVYERQTSEVYIHYVRAVNTTHNLDSGQYSMTLTTHWLGSGEDWSITQDGRFLGDPNHFVVSEDLAEFIKNTVERQGGIWDPGVVTTTDPILVDPNGPLGDGSTGQGS